MAKIYRGKRQEDGVEVSVLVIDRRDGKRVRPLRNCPCRPGYGAGEQPAPAPFASCASRRPLAGRPLRVPTTLSAHT